MPQLKIAWKITVKPFGFFQVLYVKALSPQNKISLNGKIISLKPTTPIAPPQLGKTL